MVSNIPTEYWTIDEILTSITPPGQSGPGSNGNEELNPLSQELQNANFTTIFF